ncbi:hypothetical protein QYE76_024500 [Lolium multiflorum]|uniref:Transposase (putative) gypsy type domain-containing protein n=1 Tax=Lolium multiflorum TaxID=4521 RepID=A0AAD8RC77_LOLMU|nr:hypothetical protein QYE76_024500 [Lolium multiflorum]
MATADLGSAEWERSKISAQDINLLKKMGFSKKENSLRFPKEESYPRPPIDYQLTPNSILHVSIFITLCECFLGVQPNWALWKRIFCLRHNGSHNVAYNIGGVVICVHSDVEYFDVKFPDSVQGWRKKWLYIHEESSNPVEDNIAPFDGEAKILRRRSWDAEATEAEKLATEALMTRIHDLQNTAARNCRPLMKEFIRLGTQFVGYRDHTKKLEGDLAESNKRADALATKLEQSENARKKAEADAAAVEDLRKRIHDERDEPHSYRYPEPRWRTTPSSWEKKRGDEDGGGDGSGVDGEAGALPRSGGVQRLLSPDLGAMAVALEGRTHQEYEVDGPEGDELLDALTLLEIHGDEAREGLADAEVGLSKLFPYFFPKKEEPNTFVA